MYFCPQKIDKTKVHKNTNNDSQPDTTVIPICVPCRSVHLLQMKAFWHRVLGPRVDRIHPVTMVHALQMKA